LNMTCELINLETSEDDYVHVYLYHDRIELDCNKKLIVLCEI